MTPEQRRNRKEVCNFVRLMNLATNSPTEGSSVSATQASAWTPDKGSAASGVRNEADVRIHHDAREF